VTVTFNRLMTLSLAVLIPLVIILAKVAHLIGLVQLLAMWPSFLVLVAALCYCHWRKLSKLIEPCELVLWALALVGTIPALIQAAGRSPRPLVDGTLAAIDARMQFSSASVMHLTGQAPHLDAAFAVFYDLVPLFMVAALLVPVICGHTSASQRYVLGIVCSLIPTAILFALWPAAGPWMKEGFAPAKDQSAVTAYLTILKAAGPVVLRMKDAGIVSFPSFHVVLAILSAGALSSVRVLRIPAWIFAAFICVATLTTGWHYGIDVLGGVIVAVISLLTAKWISSESQTAPILLLRPEAIAVVLPCQRTYAGESSAASGLLRRRSQE
jgi:membrane-associated phospholipid phosphatase